MTAAPVRLGRYTVLRPLAKGGMAELLLGRADGPHGFEKLVALKRIRAELRDDAELVTMFLDEARLAAGLHHPNVVQVYDVGQSDEGWFLAMEYLEGADLRLVQLAARRRDRPLPLGCAIAVAAGVCAGLHYAHERSGTDGQPLGIVHRDVSPQNVVLTWDGGVKVVDFGIARATRRATETRHGTLKGKVEYMAPEQCTGQTVDRRSDVFAIGILLWELTTGRRLFVGGSDYEVLKSIVERDAPSPSTVMPDYPRELEAIVMRALARDRGRRFDTAEELQVALEAFARQERLDLSAVSLGRLVRELFADEVAAWSRARGGDAQAIESWVETRLATRDTLADAEPTAPSAARPRTRAIARRQRRLALPIAGAAVLLATATVAAFLARPARRPAPAPAPAPVAEPIVPPPIVPPTATIEPPVSAPPTVANGSGRNHERHRPATAHPHRTPPPPAVAAPVASPPPKKPAAVDLDAPLPPR